MTLKCVSAVKEYNRDSNFEIIVFDNGSTDSTPEVLSKDNKILYIRSGKNLGLTRAYNMSVKRAEGGIFCFMHNDVFVLEDNWILKISHFLNILPNAGVAGLYGAKTIRKDGSFRGKTIVHAKKGSSSIKNPCEKVAVVDGLLLVVKKNIFETIGGFNEAFTIHFYDKDISMRALKNNFMNYVLNIPFEHLCSATRKDISDDKNIRQEANNKFIEIWGSFLPADVASWKEKITYFLKNR